MILNTLNGEQLPIYGDGLNVRDWLYVEDHCEALHFILEQGRIGEIFNIGGSCEKTNLNNPAKTLTKIGYCHSQVPDMAFKDPWLSNPHPHGWFGFIRGQIYFGRSRKFLSKITKECFNK